MNCDLFTEMAAIEDVHWWFVGRRKIIDNVLSGLPLPPESDILEAGCGTGGNLAMLARYGQVRGIEVDETARRFAVARQTGEVVAGRLPDGIPFPGRSFDLIVLFDVLEHIDDDEGAVRALHARQKPGGWLVVTVPAFRFLWSRHDEIHHHRRRYTAGDVGRTVTAAGYTIHYATYFNMWLLPLMIASRLAQRFTGSSSVAGREVPGSLLNKAFAGIMASERFLMGSTALPAGGSVLMVARNNCRSTGGPAS